MEMKTFMTEEARAPKAIKVRIGCSELNELCNKVCGVHSLRTANWYLGAVLNRKLLNTEKKLARNPQIDSFGEFNQTGWDEESIALYFCTSWSVLSERHPVGRACGVLAPVVRSSYTSNIHALWRSWQKSDHSDERMCQDNTCSFNSAEILPPPTLQK